jgi:thioredoxin reductase (NADPH)
MSTNPLLIAWDDDAAVAGRLRRDLASRYGSDYDVRAETGARAALAILDAAREQGAPVALVVAGGRGDETTAIELLRDARTLHPAAKRLLLREWFGAAAADEAVREATVSGVVDQWVRKPWEPADIGLHPAVTALLAAWTRANCPRLEVVRIVGTGCSRRSHELRDLVERNAVPYAFHDVDSAQGRRTLADAGIGPDRTPVVALLDGRVLVRPSNRELAEALGAKTRPSRPRYDLAIVGAGPAGLAAAVSASSEGLETVVIERDAVGGQAGSTSLIRNYLGFPWGISGEELASRAFRQASVFGTDFVFGRVSGIAAGGDERVLTLSDGSEVRAGAVLLATGVAYRRLGDPAIEALVGTGVYYGTARSEAQAQRGQHVVVVGGGNSAGQAALHLSRSAARVILVSRGASLRRTMSDYLVRELRERPNVDVRVDSCVVSGRGTDRLEAVTLRRGPGGATEEVAADALFLLIGAEPRLDWLSPEFARDERGFLLTGADLRARGREPLLFETSVHGVFAAGDVRSGAVPRVASAAGAGTIAIHSVHAYLEQTSQAPLARRATA